MNILKRKKFYADGIGFECQGCGKCCLARDEYGYVYLTMGDRKRISDYLGITTLEFTKKYTRTAAGRLYLRDPDKDCLFLEDGRCTIYEVRPRQCRTWPFWPENMKKRVWEKEIALLCPGIGKGRLYPADEIEEIIGREREIMDY